MNENSAESENDIDPSEANMEKSVQQTLIDDEYFKLWKI